MIVRRGLTLIEILASAVLLATLATVSALLIRDSAALVRVNDDGDSVDPVILALLADSFLHDPRTFGIGSIDAIDASLRLEWPEALRDRFRDRFRGRLDAMDDPPPVTVRRLTSHDPDVDHEWFVFTCDDGAIICRRRHRPQEEGGSR